MAEIMLIPNTALRLGPESSIRMLDAGFSTVRLEALEGTIIVDLPVPPATDAILVEADSYQLRFLRAGEYRLLKSGEYWRVVVLKGLVSVDGGGASYKIKAKRASILDGSQAAVKLSQTDEPNSAFTEWSQNRSEELRERVKPAGRTGQMQDLERLRSMGTP